MNKDKVTVFYRVVRGERGSRFPGLYAVEQVSFRGNEFLEKEIVHEWDLRIIAEAKLAQLGGGAAYKEFQLEHKSADIAKSLDTGTEPVDPRTTADLKDLTKSKLKNELRMPEVK